MQYLHNRLTNFDEIWNDACQPAELWQPIKFCEFRNPRWQPFVKSTNLNISAMDGPVPRKFGMVMWLDPPDLLSI